MNRRITSNKIVSATHLQVRITLQINMFFASNKCVLYWRRALLALERNAFYAGDEQFSAGDERVGNVFEFQLHTRRIVCSKQAQQYVTVTLGTGWDWFGLRM